MFTEDELTPKWATGQAYVLKGKFIANKVLAYYFYLCRRNLLSERFNPLSG
jgi:hypothetical protein